MFNDADKLKFKIFCQTIISAPRPIDAQPHTRAGDKMWCEDWELIEICKYLFHGPELYFGDPPPNRLKNNNLWNQKDIQATAEKLIEEFKTADDIINYLKGKRNGA